LRGPGSSGEGAAGESRCVSSGEREEEEETMRIGVLETGIAGETTAGKLAGGDA
jgi:hypothetical protein